MNRSDDQGVRDHLAGLDTIDRYVVLMFFADELTPAEIGLVLDLPPLQVTDVLESFRRSAAGLLGLSEHDPQAQILGPEAFGSI